MKFRVLPALALVAGLLWCVSSPADETDDIESLTKQAQEGAIFERFKAIRALGRTGDPRAFDPLAGFLEAADREDIQVEAARATIVPLKCSLKQPSIPPSITARMWGVRCSLAGCCWS